MIVLISNRYLHYYMLNVYKGVVIQNGKKELR